MGTTAGIMERERIEEGDAPVAVRVQEV